MGPFCFPPPAPVSVMNASGQLYADLAGYYDGFCRHVDYGEEARFMQRLFAAFAGDRRDAHAPPDYLDLACGTGQHLLRMQAQGFAGTGLDNSAAMLAAAARRCPGAEFIHADIAALAADSAFDLISCFLYSMHYNHPPPVFDEAVRRAYRALRPGGLFVFDLVDCRGLGALRTHVTQLRQDGADFTFSSGWSYPGTGETMTLQVAIRREADGVVQQWTDAHTMTATSIAATCATLAAAGFEVLVLERDFDRLREWQGASHNVILVGSKPLPA